MITAHPDKHPPELWNDKNTEFQLLKNAFETCIWWIENRYSDIVQEGWTVPLPEIQTFVQIQTFGEIQTSGEIPTLGQIPILAKIPENRPFTTKSRQNTPTNRN